MSGIYTEFAPQCTEIQLSIEQFLRQRGGDAVSRSYGLKVANKSLQLSADDVPPWKKFRKPKAAQKAPKWGPLRSVTIELKSKKKSLAFDYDKLKALQRLWLEKVSDNVPARPSSDHLSHVDLVGAQVKIVAAACSSLVGKEGIVVLETANTLDLVGTDCKMKTIPKYNTKFSVAVQNHIWTFDGRELVNRRI
jgi:RNase P/RNase MRP subunit p29